MRGVLDFYRRNPVVLAVVVVIGLAASVLVATNATGGIILPVVFLAVLGVLVGLVIAWSRDRTRRRSDPRG